MRLHGADGTPTPWLTDRAFHDRLAQPASVFWEDSPLREYLLDFARAQRIAVLLDRRVDPDQKLDLAVRQEPVLAVFRAVAISRNLRVSTLGNVVYLGPPANAEQIRTVAELRRQEIAVLGSAASRKFAKQAPIAWKDLDSPRDLLSGLAEQNGLDIVNLDRVPHDLWAAGSYPSMSLADRLTLILHQFDLTFQVAADARRVAIGPLPQDVALVREYPGGPKPETLAETWRAAMPNCQFRIAGNRIYVRGFIEDHETIDEMRTTGGKRPDAGGNPRSAGRAPEQVFTAYVPNRPLGAVLAQFAKQLGLELQIDHASLENAGVSLEQLISFRVEEATFDELFRAVLSPVGCIHQRRGNVLRIWAGHTPPPDEKKPDIPDG
jgi:hypothetical protein